MGARTSMRLDEARQLLGVSGADGIEEVKTAYRRLAFSLHPDLHPNDPGCKRKFQRINEAYLLLRHFLADRDEQPTTAPPEPESPGPSAPKASSGPQPGQAHRERQGRTAYTQASHQNANAGFYFRREEVLQDILQDPFARQVFKDIYQQVKQSGAGPVKAKGPRKVSVHLGEKSLTLDVSKGFWNSLKQYFQKQLRDEQTIHLPVSSLFPGTSIRVSVHHGLGNTKPTMVEITLPPDFVVGRPLRLKGMGRRIGPLHGDLYLRLLAK